MTDSPHEVVIVGVGVSGLLTARFLVAAGHSVLVVDQHMQPGRNNSFQGVVSSSDLFEVGLDPEHFGSSLRRLVGAGGNLFSIPHRDLLAKLSEGLSVISATDIRLLREGADIRGAVVDGIEYRAAITVFADQADPRLAEEPRIRPDWPPTQLMHLGKRRYPNSNGLDHALTWSGTSFWGQSGWAVLVPYHDEVTMVCAMALEDEMASARHILELADDLVGRGDILPIDPTQRVLDEFTEVVPIGGFIDPPNPASDGVLVVGDMLGMTSPLTRDGISTSLPMAKLAAETIGKALAVGDQSALTLGGFGESLERRASENPSLHRWMEADSGQGMRWQMVTNSQTSANLSTRLGRLVGRFGKHR